MWDELEQKDAVRQAGAAYGRVEDSLVQLQRLLLFYNPKEDGKRLTWYGMRQMATADSLSCEGGPWPKAYLKLEQACVASLRIRPRADAESEKATLTILAFAARRTVLGQREAVEYYEALTALADAPAEALQNALLAPLQSSPEAYVGLAVLLAAPLDAGMLSLLRSAIDPVTLAQALDSVKGSRNHGSARSRLWLLGNIIRLSGNVKGEAFTATIARLLGSLADEVEFESTPIDLDNASFDRDVLSKITSGLPLNTYLHEQITSLINQESIRNLLVRDSGSSTNGASNTQLLAEYALTLLRCFPRRADDIRMWLYLGPTRSSASTIPATQFFWNSAKSSTVFATIWQNSRNVLSVVKNSSPTTEARDDWTVILVFLELYTFLLKIMDDEEFMGSGRRQSAIPVSEVADLVTFLKNLGFTLYFNAADLNSSGDAPSRDSMSSSLGRHFGMSASDTTKAVSESKPVVVAGLPGLTIDYLKGLVTGLLRAVYERDSRRHFLPKDHWLMTSRFDMTSFIPGVVAEEESRHQVQEQDEEDKDAESDEDDYMDHTPGIRGHASVLRSQEARARAQRKASRKRYLESVAPRLEILQNMPFFIPFTTRVEIFRQFVQLDQEKRRNGYTDPDMWRHNMMFNPPNGIPPRDVLERHHAKIRRKNEFGDAFEQFYNLGPDLKEPIQITFVDEFDIPEAGIDGGGVTKEFLTSIITQAFDAENNENVENFFVENEKHLLYPNPTALDDLKAQWQRIGFKSNGADVRNAVKNLLQQYEFLGRIIGKCLYEGILVDVSFAGFFLKKWALTGGTGQATLESGYRANINDLRELDEGLYKGLLSLKNCPPEEVESLGLTFTVDDMVGADPEHKEVLERELIPNGANTAVTSENRLIYINRMSWYRLQGQSAAQTNAFLKGLGSIIQPSWLNMFNQSELQTLIGGAAAEINIQDLRRNTLYGGTYVIGNDGREHPSIELFWNVMAKLPDADRRSVLKFVTSTPRGPLLGFGMLNPRFSIRDSGSDEGRFPTTSTCVNLLKLPMYRSERVLREKLLAAVNSGAGFDLS